MSKLSGARKEQLKRKIRKDMKDGVFTVNNFAITNKVDRTTLARLLAGDKKLMQEYLKYKSNQQKAKSNKKEKEQPFVEEVSKDFSKNKGIGVITTKSLNIKTVNEALIAAEVDLNIWEVDRFVINSWEVTVGGKSSGTGSSETFTNFQVKVWLKRKERDFLALEELYTKIKDASPITPLIRIPNKELKSRPQRELEISLADIHLGLRCYKGMADCDWTPEDAEVMTMAMLEELLALAERFGPFEKIIFPIGHDFLHSDNVYNTTTAGTSQPEADAWQNTFFLGERLGLAIVERMKKVAPVKVLSVPGNHSRHTEIALGRILNAYYHNDKNVEIDASSSPYKFHLYGVNLIGFEHGHSIRQQVRLAALMANECRLEGWQQARFCEFHLGDQHRKGSSKPSMLEEQGVSVEFLPGLTPPNEWHRIHSYNWQKRAGMAFVWDKTAGPICRFQVNVDNYTGKIMR